MSARWTNGTRIAMYLACVVTLVGFVAQANYDFLGWGTSYDSVTLGAGTSSITTIVFHGCTYTADSSTWYYEVTGGSSPALSHWVLELCPPPGLQHEVVQACYFTVPPPPDPPGPLICSGPWEVSTDPHTLIYGIKWEVGLGDGEVRRHELTIVGNWEVGDIGVGIKAGGGRKAVVDTGTILGPICTPSESDADIVLGPLSTLTVDQPKISDWASGDFDVASFGNLAVTVTVTGSVSYSTKIVYAATALSGDPVPNPSSPGFERALTYGYDPGSGMTWTEIPYGTLANIDTVGVALAGMSGTTDKTIEYPIRVRLDTLGDRQAGDIIQFELAVKLTVTANL